jgi:hypothetical protein
MASSCRPISDDTPLSELPVGTPIIVVIANNTGGTGGTTLNGLVFQRGTAQIVALNQITQYQIPPVTIQSGDFVIGYFVPNPVNVFPMATDSTPPSRQRSYISTDGNTFTLIDTTAAGPGNFAIRAVVNIGGSSAEHVDSVAPVAPPLGPPRRRVSIESPELRRSAPDRRR